MGVYLIEKISAFNIGKYSELYSEEILNPVILQRYTERIEVQKMQRLKSATSSNGNQMKWQCGDFIIKADCLGYESLAEIMACWLLKFVKNFSFEYVVYYPCSVYEEGVFIKNGCFSHNFLNTSEEITFGDLLQSNLKPFSIAYDDLREFLLDETEIDVKRYVDTVLCLDSITINEDRHFHNLAFLYDGKYKLAPVFDNGAGCMSDQISYPMNGDFDAMIKHMNVSF